MVRLAAGRGALTEAGAGTTPGRAGAGLEGGAAEGGTNPGMREGRLAGGVAGGGVAGGVDRVPGQVGGRPVHEGGPVVEPRSMVNSP
jgi:hypothetical protein